MFDFLENLNIFELSKIRGKILITIYPKIDNLETIYLIFYNSVALGFTLFFEKLTR